MSKTRIFLIIACAILVLLVTAAILVKISPEFKATAKVYVKRLREAVASHPANPQANAVNPDAGPARADTKPAADPEPTSAASASSRVAIFSLFDMVDLYQKNGLVEVYGTALRQRKSGPVSVSKTLLQITHDEAWVVWSPDAAPAASADSIEIKIAAPAQAAGALTIGLIMKSGHAVVFERALGSPRRSPSAPLAPEDFPNKYADALAGATHYPLSADGDGLYHAKLPAEIVRELKAPEATPAVTSWLIGIKGGAGGDLEIARLALTSSTASVPGPLGTTITGKVTGAAVPPGTTVELLTDTGKRYSQTLSLGGGFSFPGLNPLRPVSLRYRHIKQDYYANLGRWFTPASSRHDITIDLRPHYVNPDGHAPDPKKARFVARRTPTTYTSFEPHTWQYWPGAGPIQEFDSTTFANNYGFIDRDRFFDNPDNCFRIAHLGASTAVSLQVRPFEKYNILLEAELGVLLGRCVEVISAGRDSGDIGALFRVARDYANKFKPDLLIIENSNYHLMQLQPELLQRSLGWNHEHSPIDSFYYDGQSKLQFREVSSDWGIHTTPLNQVELVPNINFWKTMMVPEQYMHPYGRDAFRYFVDIVRYYQQHIVGPRIVINSGLDQAQCKKECDGSVTLRDGRKIPVGAKVLLDTYRKLCAREKLDCINPDIPIGYDRPETLLNFIHDGHYSVRGHQWYAKEIATGVQKILQ